MSSPAKHAGNFDLLLNLTHSPQGRIGDPISRFFSQGLLYYDAGSGQHTSFDRVAVIVALRLFQNVVTQNMLCSVPSSGPITLDSNYPVG